MIQSGVAKLEKNASGTKEFQTQTIDWSEKGS